MWQLLKRLPVLRNPAIRRVLQQLPGIRQAKRAIRRRRRAYYRDFGRAKFVKKLHGSPEKRIVIGAWNKYDSGWIPTQRDFLDLTKPTDWDVFTPGSIDALLAEHVWEHLSEDEGAAAAQTCFTYLKPGGYLRIAVPDGLHPDPEYIQTVKAGADGERPLTALDGNAANHKALYTYRTLQAQLEDAGFQVELYEYFDEQGKFHYREWDQRKGTIWRSKRFDPRKGESVYPGTLGDYLSYSSIVLDAVRPA